MSEPTDPALWGLVAAAVPSGVVGLVSFLAKGAFEDLKTSISSVAHDVKTMAGTVASLSTEKAVLEQRLKALEDRVAKVERHYESEGA